MYNCSFFNVDTQKDFMDESGALYVQNATEIKPILKELTELAKEKAIQVINTADSHYITSKELSTNPDFVETFPPHCLKNSDGAHFIEETCPENPLVVGWDTRDVSLKDIKSHRNIILEKDNFNVFIGNPLANKVVEVIADNVIVYGVATNYCVDFVVRGLVENHKNVIVIIDAIKEIPTRNEPAASFKIWQTYGVKLMRFDQLKAKIYEFRL